MGNTDVQAIPPNPSLTGAPGLCFDTSSRPGKVLWDHTFRLGVARVRGRGCKVVRFRVRRPQEIFAGVRLPKRSSRSGLDPSFAVTSLAVYGGRTPRQFIWHCMCCVTQLPVSCRICSEVRLTLSYHSHALLQAAWSSTCGSSRKRWALASTRSASSPSVHLGSPAC